MRAAVRGGVIAGRLEEVVMDTDVLVAYATKHGTTEEVARAIADTLVASGRTVDVQRADRVGELSEYRAVVLGAALYMGRWHGDAHRFLRRHRRELESKPLAVFALGPTDETEKSWAGARAQLEHALAKSPVEPVAVELFGGAIVPETFRFPFNRIPAADVRDWDAIRAWAEALPAFLALAGAGAHTAA
jgi:menaquinone-dependent protoporphyrinogen oxidase